MNENDSDNDTTPDAPVDTFAETLIHAAEENSPDRLKVFFEALITQHFLVPERQQDTPLTNQPKYPDPFLNLLGIEIKDSVFVPLFSSEARVAEWSGHSIRTRSLTLPEILNLLPEGWWLIINPASEGEKDLSPWELELLRGGAANIPALIDELLVEEVVQDVQCSPLAVDEFSELKTKLSKRAQEIEEVESLLLVRETGKTLSEKEISALLLGVLVSPVSSARREEIQEAFSAIGAFALIGAERLKIRIGDSIEDNLMLGIFSGHNPFYSKRSPSMLSKIKSAFTS